MLLMVKLQKVQKCRNCLFRNRLLDRSDGDLQCCRQRRAAARAMASLSECS